MFSLAENLQPNTPMVRAGPAGRQTPQRTGRAARRSNAEKLDFATDETSWNHGAEHPEAPFDPGEWIPKNPALARLAEQIRQRRTRGHAPSLRCPSGLPKLDAALGGGFATSAVHELLAPQEGAAAGSVALRTAARAAGRNKWILYIDTEQDLCPPGVAQLGVPLGRLVVVRAPRSADALWVCEQTLRCRAVAAVVLPLRTIDARASRRLQLAAETGGSLGLLIRREQPGGHTFAASRLRFDPLLGETPARRMLVTVLKMREGRPREPFVVELPDAPDLVPAPAVPADRAGPTRRRLGG